VSTRRRIDWIAAKATFIGDPTRSFSKVARRFSVSVPAVRKHAKADNWEAEALKFDRDASERALRAQAKTRDEHITRAMLVRDKSFERMIADLDSDGSDVRVSVADLAAIGKYVELLLGEATERPDYGPEDVQRILTIVLALGVKRLEPARFLEEFDRAVAGVLGPAADEAAEA